MKLFELKKPLTSIGPIEDIFESLTTKINFEWRLKNGILEGIGMLGDTDIKLSIQPITCNELNGCNLTFATKRGEEFIETFRGDLAKESSRIIGAVTNGLIDKLHEYDYDFLCLIAKDNSEKRHSLYNFIARKLSKINNMYVREFENSGAKVTLMCNSSISSETCNQLISKLN